MQRFYFDHNATTPLAPEVLETLASCLGQVYGNASSIHHFGQAAKQKLEAARRQVAVWIHANAAEVVFTSGGTEADNAALRGVLAAQPGKRHLVISTVEHHAIFETADQLEHEGTAVTRVGVDHDGRLDLDALRRALRDDTALVSIMLANNETGVLGPLCEVCEIARARGVPVHTDAVNALGKTPVRVDELGVNLLSLSSHKIYGPKGVGALYIRTGTPFQKWQIGGAQERNRRGGTLNAPGIVGLGMACRILHEQDPAVNERIRILRDRLEAELTQRVPRVRLIARGTPRLPNTTCACFEGLVGASIVMLLSDLNICVSGGAACAAGAVEPSHVLKAMHVEPHVAAGQIRVSLGRNNTDADVDRLLEALPSVLEQADPSPPA